VKIGSEKDVSGVLVNTGKGKAGITSDFTLAPSFIIEATAGR